MLRTPPILLWLTLLASLVGVAAGVWLVAAGMRPPRMPFTIAGGAVAAVAGVFGVLLGAGRFREGPAIGALCVGGAIGSMAMLSGLESGVINSQLVIQASPATIPVLLALASGAALSALSGLMVIVRRPVASIRRLVIGAVLGLPVLAFLGALATGALGRLMSQVHPLARDLGFVLAVVVLVGFLAASVHYLITAFAIGVDEGERRARGEV